MEADEEIMSKINAYAMHYEDQQGPIFSNKLALKNIQSKKASYVLYMIGCLFISAHLFHS